MDFALTPEQESFVQDVRRFAREKLLPHARRIDEEGRFRTESVRELAEVGLLAGPIPRELGGGGWTPLLTVLAHEEIGAVCGNTRGFLAVHTGLVSQTIARHGSTEQKQRLLPELVSGRSIGCFALTEEQAGSDVGALACRASKAAGGYRVTGKKVWITNGGVAHVIVLFATEDPSLAHKGITAFVLDANSKGIRRDRMPGRELGHRGSDHATVWFDDVEVPASSVLGKERDGFRVAMDGLTFGRLSVAAGAVGIHRATLEACLTFARERHQFGKPIGEFQMVQERIADMATSLEASRLLVRRCAVSAEGGKSPPVELAMAKLFATEAAFEAAEQAVLIHGGRGYSTEFPVERYLRDLMGMRIYEGTSMIQKTIIARKLLEGEKG